MDDGDSVLFESPAYSGTMGAISPTHAELIEVECTSEGLDPVHLEHVLSNWESDYPGKSRPRILYTIPMGSNPTGYSIPEHKKVQMYVFNPIRLSVRLRLNSDLLACG